MANLTKVILVLCAFGLQVTGLSADEALKKRFLEQAPLAWKKNFPPVNQFRLNYNQEFRDEKGKITDRLETTFCYSAPACVREETTISSNGRQRTMVQGFNSKYDFELRKTASDGYALVEADVFEKKNALPHYFLASTARVARNGFNILPYEVPFEFADFNSEFCQINGIAECKELDLALIRVDYSWSYPSGLFPVSTVAPEKRGEVFLLGPCKGSIWFDPDNAWLPQRANIIEQYGNWDVTWNYRKENGRTIPSEIVMDYKSTSPESVDGLRTYHGFTYSFAKIPSDRFRLTHYGLPEPPGVSWGVPYWMWFFFSGIVLVVAALLLRRKFLKPNYR